MKPYVKPAIVDEYNGEEAASVRRLLLSGRVWAMAFTDRFRERKLGRKLRRFFVPVRNHASPEAIEECRRLNAMTGEEQEEYLRERNE